MLAAVIINVHLVSFIWGLAPVPMLLTSTLVILRWKSQVDSVSDAAPSGDASWHDIILWIFEKGVRWKSETWYENSKEESPALKTWNHNNIYLPLAPS